MLLQLHADLPEHFPEHERRLYIFTCRKKTCRRKEGSIRVLRSVRISETPRAPSKSKSPATKIQQNMGDSLFGNRTGGQVNGNPFSSPAATHNDNPFSSNRPRPPTPTSQIPLIKVTDDLPATFAQKARISSPTVPAKPEVPFETWPTDFPSPYPKYNLDADYETLDIPEKPTGSSQAMYFDETNGSSSTAVSGKEDPDAFENTMDKTFQRFADRLAQNPLQVLRYEFGGSPLLYSKSDVVGKRLGPYQSSSQSSNTKVSSSGRNGGSGIPPCANCGSARVFETQLTPQAICELEVDEMGLEGMDWGTVIVGVCGEDCEATSVEVGQVGYVEEWVGVQWEEATMPRK